MNILKIKNEILKLFILYLQKSNFKFNCISKKKEINKYELCKIYKILFIFFYKLIWYFSNNILLFIIIIFVKLIMLAKTKKTTYINFFNDI